MKKLIVRIKATVTFFMLCFVFVSLLIFPSLAQTPKDKIVFRSAYQACLAAHPDVDDFLVKTLKLNQYSTPDFLNKIRTTSPWLAAAAYGEVVLERSCNARSYPECVRNYKTMLKKPGDAVLFKAISKKVEELQLFAKGQPHNVELLELVCAADMEACYKILCVRWRYIIVPFLKEK